MAACNEGLNNGTTSGASQPKMSDSELENAIKTKLNSDAQLKAADLGVSAEGENNAATLSGTVESQTLRMRAVELARSAHAGLIITDKIDVKPRELSRAEYTDENARTERERASSTGEKIGNSLDDAWIHAKIVSKLIGNPDTPERKINVDVINNVVTLRGTVDSNEEKTEAERVAKGTEGVKSVKNMLKVNKMS
ncbi:MAG: BON domain-containing protein [Acidobacteria bacterium]|nr:BON domain-containing protein [Acidobacteriota bacterium]